MSVFEAMEASGGSRCLVVADAETGLRAIIAIDSLVLGPAAGGIRTKAYAREADAIQDAVKLASAMTLKCAIAGLNAGGGKTVVIDHPGMDRPRAFERLGEFIEDLGGAYGTAGDLGTTADDLAAVARGTRHISTDGADLSDAAGRGVLRSIEACAQVQGIDGVRGLRVAVQGCGAMGEAVARALSSAGARLVLADTDTHRAQTLADELGAATLDPAHVLSADVDIVAPCAIGGVVTGPAVQALRAWAICGAANNQIADEGAAQTLVERNILYVPDFLASAGTVIRGIAGEEACDRLIDSLREKAVSILTESRAQSVSSHVVAARMARQRIDQARRARPPLRG